MVLSTAALLPPLFLDGEALVIDKPAGLPVDMPRDRAASVESLAPELRFGFQRPPVAVHRLDHDTSGCLLLARNPKANVRFAAAFAAGAVEKVYLAIVDGVPAAAEGMIELALAKVSSAAAGWRIVADARGKPAVTRWRRLAAVNGRALLALRPATGRTHQLRVHAREGLGLSIVGDPLYGRAVPAGMMLHAWRLTVPRADKPPVAAEARFPTRFATFGFAPESVDAG